MTQPSIATWASDMIILDRSDQIEPIDPMRSFALDELLCKEAARSKLSICHIWRHPHAFVLGQRDYRLPYAKEAMDWLSSIGYMPMVRNSGGAAVPLDLGVVNLSLIFPIVSPSTSFHHDFARMTQLISEALAPVNAAVDVGEVSGAYCPGDYDMSINGLKFCGIAQRRQLHAFCVHAFVVADKKGSDRASLVRQFYDRAAIGAPEQSYPLVAEANTASLEELLGIGTQAFITSIKECIRAYSSVLTTSSLILPNDEQVIEMAGRLRARYETR